MPLPYVKNVGFPGENQPRFGWLSFKRADEVDQVSGLARGAWRSASVKVLEFRKMNVKCKTSQLPSDAGVILPAVRQPYYFIITF